jgi:hypothetical protein
MDMHTRREDDTSGAGEVHRQSSAGGLNKPKASCITDLVYEVPTGPVNEKMLVGFAP